MKRNLVVITIWKLEWQILFSWAPKITADDDCSHKIEKHLLLGRKVTTKMAALQRIDAFELWCWRNTLESPLDCKEIKPVSPKGNQPWILIGRTDAEAEAPILWPPDSKNWLTGKDPEDGKDWQQKRVMEDEMVGWHHQPNEHEFEPTSEDSEGQGSLVCCSPQGRQESDTSERLNKKGRKIVRLKESQLIPSKIQARNKS